MTTPHSFGRAAFIALGLCTAVSLTACKSGSTSNAVIPATSTARLTSLSGQMPGDVLGAAFIGDLPKMRATLTRLNKEAGSIVPQIGAIQQQVVNELGIDLLDAKSVQEAGISDTSLALALSENHFTLYSYVSDATKLDAFIAKGASKISGASGAPVIKTIGDLKVKTLGTGPSQVAWAYSGKLVMVVMSSPEASTPSEASAALAGMIKSSVDPANKSLAQSASFKRFAKVYPGDKHVLSVYGDSKAISASKVFNKLLKSSGSADDEAYTWFKANSEVLGAGLANDGNEFVFRAMFGGNEAFQKTLKGLAEGVEDSGVGRFSTSTTLAALRLNTNMMALWNLQTSTLPKDERAQLQKQYAQLSKDFGIDFEKDIIGNFKGDVGIFFNGIDLGSLMNAQRGGGSPTDALKIVAAGRVKDPAKAKALLEGITKQLNMRMKDNGPIMIDGKEVESNPVAVVDWNKGSRLEIPNVGNFYISGDLLIFALPKVTEGEVKAALDGNGTAAPVAYGEAVASKTALNGLFVNVPGIWGVVGPFAGIAGLPSEVTDAIQKVDGVMLQANGDSEAMLLEVKVSLKGGAPTPAPAPK